MDDLTWVTWVRCLIVAVSYLCAGVAFAAVMMCWANDHDMRAHNVGTMVIVWPVVAVIAAVTVGITLLGWLVRTIAGRISAEKP